MSNNTTAAAPAVGTAEQHREQRPAVPANRTTMRAARYHRISEPFVVDTVAKPIARSAEVVVEVKACGIVPNMRNALWLPPENQRPTLPAIYGLDAAGVVVERGPLVHGIEIGDRVYVNPLRYCGSCRKCRLGAVRACSYATLSGYFGVGPKSKRLLDNYPFGGFAEYMSAPQYSLVKLPDNVGFETAARWGYLGTAYSALRRAKVNMTTNVLINGISGTLGIGAAIFALALGAPKVLGLGRNVELLEEVKALAPDRIEVRPTGTAESVSAWAREVVGEDGVEAVIDALPTFAPVESLLAAMAALSRGGVHVNIGGVIEDVPINLFSMMNDDKTLVGSAWFTTSEAQEMADLAAASSVNLDVFEHQTFGLNEIDLALEKADTRHGGFTNLVIRP
jgi:D-arabinose 1-dehydrogenase-like Zn-dependent alcohol dehydrogenase